MWQCIDCGKEFEGPGCIGDLVGRTCPFCGSVDIVDYSDFNQSEINDAIDSFGCSEQDYIDASLEMPEHIEEQIADMYATTKDLISEMPEHQNCPCVNEHNIPEAYGYIRKENLQLSFDDLEINEKLLIGLPVTDAILNMQKKPGQYDAYERYITEMNERFLHTFLDDSFVP